MVVLTFSNRMKNIFFFFCLALLFSCSKDRLIEIEPIVYVPEVWKKNITVYTLKNNDGVTLYQDTTYFGSSLPDTLTLTFDDFRFSRRYVVEEDKGMVSLESDSGNFVLNNDSIFLFGTTDTLNYKIIEKVDSVFVVEREVMTSSSIKNYTTYYDVVDINFENEISFLNDIYNPIFYNNGNGKCMPCHSAGTLYPVELVPIDVAYNDLMTGFNQNGEAYINVLQPEESYLYKQITGQTQPMMPTSSSERGPLNSYEISTVLKWIEQGAKNN